MRVLETKTHGYLDYITALLLIVLPFVMGWDINRWESIVPIALGVLTIIMSLMTAYELGATNAISMPVHLTMDIVSGIVLAASPWIFGFADRIFWPHLIVGLFEIAVSLFTKTVPKSVPHHAHSHSHSHRESHSHR